MATIATVPRRQAAAALLGRPLVGVAPASRVLTGAVAAIANAPFKGFGWAYIADGAYTADAPLGIPATAPTQITIDGLAAATDASFLKAPFAGWPFWHDGKFWPYSVGDEYTLRLDFSAISLAINNGVRALLDIGSAAGPIFDDYQPFGVGAGVQRNFRFDIPIYAKTTFETNGAIIDIASDAPMQIWSIGLFIRPGSVGTPR